MSKIGLKRQRYKKKMNSLKRKNYKPPTQIEMMENSNSLLQTLEFL
jgi:hypothetical protein